MNIIERGDGLYHLETILDDARVIKSSPFEKDSEKWNELIGEGCEVKHLPQSDKDAYASQQERDSILSELSALDLPPYKIERALAGDQQAIDDIKANEVKKNELRQKLAAI